MNEASTPDAPEPGSVDNRVGGTVYGNLVQARDVGQVVMPPAWRVPITPRQVRPPTGYFVDRADVLARLDEVVAGGRRRHVVVLGGPPGIGRDTVIRQWVDRVRDRFPGGDLYVDCADLTAPVPGTPSPGSVTAGRMDVEAALELVLSGLGINRAYLTGGAELLQRYYATSTADQPMIVVLRHVTNAAQVHALMPTAPGSVVLVTADRELSDLDATFLDVGPLDAASGVELLTRVCGAERIRAERDAAEELVRTCAGHPLALRTRAAPTLPPRRRSLRDVLAEPSVRTVKGAMDSELEAAYRRLPPAAAGAYPVLARLPVHDFTASGVAAALDRDIATATAVLDDLVAAYLLTEEPHGRYRMHAALREHASRQGDEPAAAGYDAAGATPRLIGHYLRTSAAADRALLGDRTRVTGVPRLLDGHDDPFAGSAKADVLETMAAEKDNFAAVVRAAARAGLHTQTWQLAETLTAYYLHHRHVSYWIETSELGITAAWEAQHAAAELRLRTLISRPYSDRGDLAKARAHLDAAADLVPAAGNVLLEASLWEFRGRLLDLEGSPDAEAAYVRAEELHDRGESPRGVALAIYFRGLHRGHRDDTAEALRLLADAEERLTSLDDARMAARARLGAGVILARTGEPDRATALLEDAAHALEGTYYAAEAWETLADLAKRQSDRTAERARLQHALEILTESGHPRAGTIRERLDALP